MRAFWKASRSPIRTAERGQYHIPVSRDRQISLETISLTLNELEIRNQSFPQDGLSKDTPLRNITHQQFDDHEELVYSLVEARSDGRGRCSTNGMLEMSVGFGIVELYRSNTSW